ncbi:hypothetical protein B0H14DRAFT_2931881 [Mycena olivaceomarginata]|nr:hypothetical protein B0H14DRAFT_2931881 [Mycena olivaceomarginata]
MSSDDNSESERERAISKQKRVQRACDMCRRKKRGFLSVYYNERLLTQDSLRALKSYVQELENQVKTAEALLEKAKSERTMLSTDLLNSPFPTPHSDDLTFADIDESFRALSIDNTAAQGFQGKSSGAMLVKAAVDLRNGSKKKNESLLASVPPPHYAFPEDDLLASLISLYFENVNTAAVNRHFHLEAQLCAVGARYSTDPRVSIPDAPSGETAGWKYFDQVKLSGHLVQTHPTLYDLQTYYCTSSPRTCWTLVGFGMRLGQDIGFHRVLFLFDAQISTALGRCIALQSHDFDIEMPIICDDEYWAGSPDNSTPMFSQPAGKPSQIAYFNCMLQLNRILSFSCKILYSTNRSKTLIGLGDDKWEEQVVVELDSALNTWFETIPAHLRWDPDNIQSDVFFDQSAVLYCTYYHTRIIIHRPFIPAMRRASNPTHLPSLAICNTAARACSHVAQVQQQRRPNNPLWFSQTPLFTSGIVLLLNIWGGSGSGMAKVNAAEKDLADVHRCMSVLSAQRQRWPSAGALLDTLQQLVAVDRPAQPAHVQMAPATIPPPPIPDVAPPQSAAHYHQPFSVPFAPPMYDPALETAPPDYLAGDEWVFGDGQLLFQDQAMPTSYEDPSFATGFSSMQEFDGTTAHDLGYQDFMEVDTNTIALWSQAPTSFGFVDDVHEGQPYP